MSRLIDADLLDAQATYDEQTDMWVITVEDLNNAPTVDAVPEIRGEWKYGVIARDRAVVCSVCDSASFTVSNYCPYCGSRNGGAR